MGAVRTPRFSVYAFLAINVLSIMLLAASNYCMQCLSSPAVDWAHSRHIWLNNVVPSVPTLRRIAQNRIILWWLSASWGIPLHFLYNSADFSTLASQEYSVYIASDELISEIGINWTATDRQVGLSPADTYRNTSQWQNLTNTECMKAYGQSFLTTRSDV